MPGQKALDLLGQKLDPRDRESFPSRNLADPPPLTKLEIPKPQLPNFLLEAPSLEYSPEDGPRAATLL